jgi:hypothetical protein
MSTYPDWVELWEAPIWPSARRHGISDDAIRHALLHHFAYAADSEDELVDLLLGPDHAGNLIEVGVLDTGEDRVIIHAMPARLSRFFPAER